MLHTHLKHRKILVQTIPRLRIYINICIHCCPFISYSPVLTVRDPVPRRVTDAASQGSAKVKPRGKRKMGGPLGPIMGHYFFTEKGHCVFTEKSKTGVTSERFPKPTR